MIDVGDPGAPKLGVDQRIPSGLTSMVGPIMPMGIATQSAILLIDCVMMLRHNHGLNRPHATIDARNKQAGPIAMTTIAKCARMLPIHLGLGADPGFGNPMAFVVIGGRITSTFLSLLGRANARMPVGAEGTA